MKDFIAAVKRYASDHYNEDGWDYVIEAMTDDEIVEYLKDPISGVATTEAEAIAAIGELVKLWDDKRKDIAATAW